ncbi:uncharacterized protein LOC126702488 [Quercus robur]|uniref:uncharacterized protein LOC126702428 n=1 Tax=Quercus robur TaxID=38942 RepID=UPI002162A827|nr:uncharacterized protein LOC126702428 [Quercus robur]XP_050257147.1 uncharacterized protein LOC126702488 [Quercus robur]
MDNSDISKQLENIRARIRSVYNIGQSSNPSREDKNQGYTGSEKYNDINSDALVVSKDDFLDNEWADRPAVRLTTLTDQQVCQLGRFLLHSLQTRISKQGVAVIFVLAFHLRAPGVGSTERMFEATDPHSKPSDREYSDFEDVLVPTRESIQASERGDVVENAKAYSFLAASMLRLFTRSSENYCPAWNHIVNGFKTFYVRHCPVTKIVPKAEVIQAIHVHFACDIFKATLYRLLYMSNSKPSNDSLKGFLYDNHLSHNGMHIVSIFCRLRDALNCNPDILLKAIRAPQFDRQIQALVKILGYMNEEVGQHERQMWKYGRIFDEKFMSVLQTKACPKLVMMLAAALQQERPEGAENILKIKQLEDVSEENKKKCIMVAEALRKMIKSSHKQTA